MGLEFSHSSFWNRPDPKNHSVPELQSVPFGHFLNFLKRLQTAYVANMKRFLQMCKVHTKIKYLEPFTFSRLVPEPNHFSSSEPKRTISQHWKIVFEKLNNKDLISAKSVCRHFHRVAIMCIHKLAKVPLSNIDLQPFKYLTTLSLGSSDTITNDCLKHLKSLRSFSLNNNTRITNDGLKHLKCLCHLV